MKFSLGGAIAGFAKRGLQYNDEQRKLTNDAIVKAVGVAAADTMEQHKARRALKNEYVSGATKLKGMGLSDAQVEQAYLTQGNKAHENLAASLQSEKTAWTIQQKKDGNQNPTWTTDMTKAWLSKQFAGLEGKEGRSIEAQSQAFVDYKMPMQAVNMGALASGIAASSGEITFESPEAKQARIQQQMSGMMGAETGGANVDSAPATFGFEGASFVPQASAADIRQARVDEAAVTTAEGQAVITGAEADVAEEVNQLKVDSLKIANDLSTQKFDQLKKTNPITIQLLEAQVGKEEAQEIIAGANAKNADAMAALDLAIKQATSQAADLKNRALVQQLAQDKEKFAYTIDLLGLQIEGQDLANKMKFVDSKNYEELAGLNMTLKKLEVAGANLRNIGQVQANSLHQLNKEKLQKSIELIDASIADKQNPTTFQAHILQTQTAIDALDPTDPDYETKLKTLQASQTQTVAMLEMYTAASTKATGEKTSYSSLVNSYGKTLEAKLAEGGFGDNLFFPPEGGTPQWRGGPDGRGAFDEIVARHQAQFYEAIGKYNNGAEALAALGIEAPDPVPVTDREVFDEMGGLESVEQVIDDSQLQLNQVYLVPGRGAMIAVNKNGQLELDDL